MGGNIPGMLAGSAPGIMHGMNPGNKPLKGIGGIGDAGDGLIGNAIGPSAGKAESSPFTFVLSRTLFASSLLILTGSCGILHITPFIPSMWVLMD